MCGVLLDAYNAKYVPLEVHAGRQLLASGNTLLLKMMEHFRNL